LNQLSFRDAEELTALFHEIHDKAARYDYLCRFYLPEIAALVAPAKEIKSQHTLNGAIDRRRDYHLSYGDLHDETK
jgi:hypothetical protein